MATKSKKPTLEGAEGMKKLSKNESYEIIKQALKIMQQNEKFALIYMAPPNGDASLGNKVHVISHGLDMEEMAIIYGQLF